MKCVNPYILGALLHQLDWWQGGAGVDFSKHDSDSNDIVQAIAKQYLKHKCLNIGFEKTQELVNTLGYYCITTKCNLLFSSLYGDCHDIQMREPRDWNRFWSNIAIGIFDRDITEGFDVSTCQENDDWNGLNFFNVLYSPKTEE